MFTLGQMVGWTATDQFERTAQARFGKDKWFVVQEPATMLGGRLQGRRCVMLAKVATGDARMHATARWVPVENVKVEG